MMPRRKKNPIEQELEEEGFAEQPFIDRDNGHHEKKEDEEEKPIITGSFRDSDFDPETEVDDPYKNVPRPGIGEKYPAYQATFNPTPEQLSMMGRTPSAMLMPMVRYQCLIEARKPYMSVGRMEQLKSAGENTYRGIPLTDFRTKTMDEIELEARLKYSIGLDGKGRDEAILVLTSEEEEEDENRIHNV